MSLQTIVNQHRAALAAKDKLAADEMTRYYDTIWQRIYLRLNSLLGQMQKAQQDGATIKVSWLYEQDRLKTLMPQIEQEFNLFAQQAEVTTRNLMLSGYQTGTHDAMALLNQTFAQAPAGLSLSFNRVPHAAIADVVGAFQDGSPVAKLFDGFGADSAKTIKDALVSGIALGKAPRVIASDIQESLGKSSLARALVIAQNESVRAYRSANLASFQQNADVLDGWVWSCDLGPRTCAMCLAMNGSVHGLDETLDSHVGCRCAMVPKPRSWASLGFSGIPEVQLNIPNGEEWFARQDVATQRAIIGTDIGYQAYKKGDVTLKDFVGHASDPSWGKSRYQKSAKELGIK